MIFQNFETLKEEGKLSSHSVMLKSYIKCLAQNRTALSRLIQTTISFQALYLYVLSLLDYELN